MYQNYTVKIPDLPTGITKKTIKGTTYVYYTYGRTYISEKKYSQGKDTSIGKTDPGDDTMMYPNANFFRFFPDSVPNEDRPPERSGCLRIGTFVVVRKILQEYKLECPDWQGQWIVSGSCGLYAGYRGKCRSVLSGVCI